MSRISATLFTGARRERATLFISSSHAPPSGVALTGVLLALTPLVAVVLGFILAVLRVVMVDVFACSLLPCIFYTIVILVLCRLL